MTWHAQSEKLVLAGDEARLFREAILWMCDSIVSAPDDEESFFEGARVFDRMSRSQQLASLEVVSRYLFHPTPECLPLTAWSEATLASVLHEIRALVHMEIEGGEATEWRRVVTDASAFQDELQGLDDAEALSCVLDAYEGRFLWDNDFEGDDVADLPPEQAEHFRCVMSISDEYYSEIPPELSMSDTLEHGAKRVWMAIDGK